MLIGIGRINGPHGLRGQVRVEATTDFPERYRTTRKVFVAPATGEGDAWETEVQSAAPGPRGQWLIALAGVTTRDGAERLKGCYLMVPEEELANLPAGSHYVFRLIGLAAVTEDGREVGTVVDVLSRPANDVFVIRPAQGREYLVAATRDSIASVSPETGRVVLRSHPAETGE
jgi:16S rRNA processing protein RimM